MSSWGGDTWTPVYPALPSHSPAIHLPCHLPDKRLFPLHCILSGTSCPDESSHCVTPEMETQILLERRQGLHSALTSGQDHSKRWTCTPSCLDMGRSLKKKHCGSLVSSQQQPTAVHASSPGGLRSPAHHQWYFPWSCHDIIATSHAHGHIRACLCKDDASVEDAHACEWQTEECTAV